MSEEDEIWKKLREIDRIIELSESEEETGITTSDDIDKRTKYKEIIPSMRKPRKVPTERNYQRETKIGDDRRTR